MLKFIFYFSTRPPLYTRSHAIVVVVVVVVDAGLLLCRKNSWKCWSTLALYREGFWSAPLGRSLFWPRGISGAKAFLYVRTQFRIYTYEKVRRRGIRMHSNLERGIFMSICVFRIHRWWYIFKFANAHKRIYSWWKFVTPLINRGKMCSEIEDEEKNPMKSHSRS